MLTHRTVQCWCGNQPPLASKLATDDKVCNMACSGSSVQACGGTGTYASVYYDISKWSPPPPAAVSSVTVASVVPGPSAEVQAFQLSLVAPKKGVSSTRLLLNTYLSSPTFLSIHSSSLSPKSASSHLGLVSTSLSVTHTFVPTSTSNIMKAVNSKISIIPT